jgi:hypothetical protein
MLLWWLIQILIESGLIFSVLLVTTFLFLFFAFTVLYHLSRQLLFIILFHSLLTSFLIRIAIEQSHFEVSCV